MIRSLRMRSVPVLSAKLTPFWNLRFVATFVSRDIRLVAARAQRRMRDLCLCCNVGRVPTRTYASDAVTSEDGHLITGRFDRMRDIGAPTKDRDAEALINQSVRSFPDAPYMLVQSVLVQEHALQQATARIQDLEEDLRSQQRDQPGQQSGGSFLGGLFGRGRQTADEPTASRDASMADRAKPSVGDQSPSAPAPPGSGGFLQQAMTTTAGAAGGMLAAGAIRDLLGGRAHANPAHADDARRDREAQARQDEEDDARADAREQDAQDDAEADARDNRDSGGEIDI